LRGRPLTKREQRQRERGRENYEKVCRSLGVARVEMTVELLEVAVRTGFLKSVRATRQYGSEDSRGWDIVVMDRSNNIHPLQIKSSELSTQQFRHEHPDVPVFVPILNEEPDKSLERLKKEFPLLKGFNLPHRVKRQPAIGMACRACPSCDGPLTICGGNGLCESCQRLFYPVKGSADIELKQVRIVYADTNQ
jgi:hypothetical protein